MASTPSVVMASPTSVASQPPIIQFFQLGGRLIAAAATTVTLIATSAWSVARILLSPIGFILTALSSPILYILSPFLTLLHLLVDVLFYTPYILFSRAAHALYPVYAFVCITVIVAAGIGFCARYASSITNLILAGPSVGPSSPTPDPPQPGTKSTQQRILKKVAIKEEKVRM